MNCPDCGEKMTPQEMPVRSFRFWRVEIWWWGDEYHCAVCTLDRHNEPYEEAYNHGLEDGWIQAQEHEARWGGV